MRTASSDVTPLRHFWMSLTAGGGVLVMGECHQLRSDDPFLGDQLDLAGMANQPRGEQHGDVIDVLSSVAGGLLSLEMGVDRHLGDAPTRNGVDEVDGGGAALRPDQIEG